jgi:hypothetical protein
LLEDRADLRDLLLVQQRSRPTRTLGGLAFGPTYGRPEPATEAVVGAPALKGGALTVSLCLAKEG